MAKIFKWEEADFKWNSNPYTWDEVVLVLELAEGGAGEEEWNLWNKEKKKRFIKLVLKVHGDTITEKKQREIKQYKIKAEDIKIVVKEVLGVEMIAENVSL
jgi:hypothetical protein